MCEVPEEYNGAVVELLANRRGEMLDLITNDKGMTTMKYKAGFCPRQESTRPPSLSRVKPLSIEWIAAQCALCRAGVTHFQPNNSVCVASSNEHSD